jgi:hypothetical protein
MSPSGTSTTPGWRSWVTRANVSSAARIAARGIGGTFGVVAALAIFSYSDVRGEEGRSDLPDIATAEGPAGVGGAVALPVARNVAPAAGCATGPPPGLWLCDWVCGITGPSPSLRLASLTTRQQLRVRVVKDRDPVGGGVGGVVGGPGPGWWWTSGSVDRVVDGGVVQEEKRRRKKTRRKKKRGVLHGGLVSARGAAADFGWARRPAPQTRGVVLLDRHMTGM